MRRSFDAFALAVKERMQLDPQSGALFVFASQRGIRLKVRWFDRNGYCILYNQRSLHYTSFDLIGASWTIAAYRAFAARSTTRFHRLHCFMGGVAPGSS